MDRTHIYDEPSHVEAKDGTVEVEGPDAVDVRLTPEAASETSERLMDAAMLARGQALLTQNKRRNDEAT